VISILQVQVVCCLFSRSMVYGYIFI